MSKAQCYILRWDSFTWAKFQCILLELTDKIESFWNRKRNLFYLKEKKTDSSLMIHILSTFLWVWPDFLTLDLEIKSTNLYYFSHFSKIFHRPWLHENSIYVLMMKSLRGPLYILWVCSLNTPFPDMEMQVNMKPRDITEDCRL